MQRNRINEFLDGLTEECKDHFRKYKKFSLKIIDSTQATNFNNICLREKVCPKSIHITYCLAMCFICSYNCVQYLYSSNFHSKFPMRYIFKVLHTREHSHIITSHYEIGLNPLPLRHLFPNYLHRQSRRGNVFFSCHLYEFFTTR